MCLWVFLNKLYKNKLDFQSCSIQQWPGTPRWAGQGSSLASSLWGVPICSDTQLWFGISCDQIGGLSVFFIQHIAATLSILFLSSLQVTKTSSLEIEFLPQKQNEQSITKYSVEFLQFVHWNCHPKALLSKSPPWGASKKWRKVFLLFGRSHCLGVTGTIRDFKFLCFGIHHVPPLEHAHLPWCYRVTPRTKEPFERWPHSTALPTKTTIGEGVPTSGRRGRAKMQMRLYDVKISTLSTLSTNIYNVSTRNDPFTWDNELPFSWKSVALGFQCLVAICCDVWPWKSKYVKIDRS